MSPKPRHESRTGLDPGLPSHQFLTAVLNGQHAEWPDDADGDLFLANCRTHGVTTLAAHHIDKLAIDIPQDVGEALNQARNASMLFEKLHAPNVAMVIDALDQAGIASILLKGTTLAYSLYEHPWLRTRGDTDILVDSEPQILTTLFARLGYKRFDKAEVELQSYQDSYLATDQMGCTHVFDVHRQINNRQVFAFAFPVEELFDNTTPIRKVAPTARCLNLSYQLLHACIHRTTHLHSPHDAGPEGHAGDRLIWLYDISLITRAMSEEDWQVFFAQCERRQQCHVAFAALAATQEWFPVDVDAAELERLRQGPSERSSWLLSGGTRRPLLHDIASIPGIRNKLKLVREIALPPADRILARYNRSSRWWLPFLYCHRALKGLFRHGR